MDTNDAALQAPERHSPSSFDRRTTERSWEQQHDHSMVSPLIAAPSSQYFNGPDLSLRRDPLNWKLTLLPGSITPS